MAEDRTYLRGISSEEYNLKELRRRQLAADRVRVSPVTAPTPDRAGHEKTWWQFSPDDDPLLTQTLQVHFTQLPPHSANKGHGHQNEAVFYILEGRGYEIHDDIRYDWSKGDLVIVHTDSVHRHYNPYDETATALVFKAKSMWMYLGLVQQGRGAPFEADGRYSDRQRWSRIWTPGVEKLQKVMSSGDLPWTTTPLGRVRVLCSAAQPHLRVFSVDVFQLEIPGGSRSGRRWQMADEVVFVQSGSGYSLHWEVAHEIGDRYYAHFANEPTRHEFHTGDTMYVPQNTIAQHFITSEEPGLLLSGQNRIFGMLGYDQVEYLEAAPESQPTADNALEGVSNA